MEQHARLLTVACCCSEGDGALEQLQKEVQKWYVWDSGAWTAHGHLVLQGG